MRLGRAGEERERVPLVTTETVAGYEIRSVVGFVSGGGSNPAKALDKLEREAADWDADAVVAVRVDSTAANSWLGPFRESFAYGTAVKLRRNA